MDEKSFVLYPYRYLIECEDFSAQKKLIKVRRDVNRLYFELGWSRNRITKRLGVSKHFVIEWTQSRDQDVTIDHRGWPSGMRRKWTAATERRIKMIFKSLEKDPKEFFSGATAIQHCWRLEYPDDVPPPLRTIGQILKDLDLSGRRSKSSSKGAARYLCYPEKTIYGGYLGDRVFEADFIERRYLKGSGAPLHFIGFSSKKPPRLRYFVRIEALTADEFIGSCDRFFKRFEVPGALKIDNASAFHGSTYGKRTLSRTILYLLGREVTPVFAVPRRPFTQASIEGNNSVFSRFFWNRRNFESLEDVDRQLEWFNESSLRYTEYKRPERSEGREGFIPRVYFLRQVRESERHKGAGSIDVLNEEVLLPAPYINFFVLAQWDLRAEQLTVSIERDEGLQTLSEMEFAINKLTKKKLKKGGAHSFCI